MLLYQSVPFCQDNLISRAGYTTLSCVRGLEERSIFVMSQEDVERFLGRLVTDSDFLKKCMESLEETCVANGFLFSETEFGALRKIDLRKFFIPASGIGDRIRRA